MREDERMIGGNDDLFEFFAHVPLTARSSMSLRPPTPPPRRTLSRQGSSGSTRGSSFGGGDDDDEGDGTSGWLGLMEGASERLRAAVRFVWERGAAEADRPRDHVDGRPDILPCPRR